MGLALAAVRLQPLNYAPGLTTMPTHKVGAEIASFVCIDESAVSATLTMHKTPGQSLSSRSLPETAAPLFGKSAGAKSHPFSACA